MNVTAASWRIFVVDQYDYTVREDGSQTFAGPTIATELRRVLGQKGREEECIGPTSRSVG